MGIADKKERALLRRKSGDSWDAGAGIAGTQERRAGIAGTQERGSLGRRSEDSWDAGAGIAGMQEQGSLLQLDRVAAAV